MANCYLYSTLQSKSLTFWYLVFEVNSKSLVVNVYSEAAVVALAKTSRRRRSIKALHNKRLHQQKIQ